MALLNWLLTLTLLGTGNYWCAAVTAAVCVVSLLTDEEDEDEDAGEEWGQ